MGVFDPAHKKIIARAPAYFRAWAPLWGPAIEMVIEDSSMPEHPDIFRAYVVGLLALRASKTMPHDWPASTVAYATATANRASKHLSQPSQDIAAGIYAGIIIELGEHTHIR